MECISCKIQYVGKAETTPNLRSNKHRYDTKKANSIITCNRFQQQGYFPTNMKKFIIIDKLVNQHGSKETLREMLVIREHFWIQKLKTLVTFRFIKNSTNKKDFHAASLSSDFVQFRSCDITNDIIVK